MTKIIYTITRMVIGGAQETAKCTAEWFHRRGHEVLFVTGDEAGREGHYEVDAPTLKMPTLVRRIRPKDDLITLYKLYRLFRREKPDIVHARTAKARLLTPFAARLAGVKVIVQTMHGWSFNNEIDSKRWLYVLVERFATMFYHWTVMVSEIDLEEGRRLGILKKNVSIIRSGVNVDRMRGVDPAAVARLRQELAPGGGKIVTLVGRLSRPKTPEVFAEAAAAVLKGHPGTRFILVGDGALRESVQEFIAGRGLGASVVMLGLRLDAPEIVAASDIVVHSSTHEGMPKTVLEGMAAGKPVVATRVGGVPVAVQDEVNGLMVDTYDAPAMAHAIERLLTDEALCARLTESARSRVDEFSLEKTFLDTEALYEQLLDTHGRSNRT